LLFWQGVILRLSVANQIEFHVISRKTGE